MPFEQVRLPEPNPDVWGQVLPVVDQSFDFVYCGRGQTLEKVRDYCARVDDSLYVPARG